MKFWKEPDLIFSLNLSLFKPDHDQIGKVIQIINSSEMAPLQGVVHSALVLKDELVRDATPENHQIVMRPRMYPLPSPVSFSFLSPYPQKICFIYHDQIRCTQSPRVDERPRRSAAILHIVLILQCCGGSPWPSTLQRIQHVHGLNRAAQKSTRSSLV